MYRFAMIPCLAFSLSACGGSSTGNVTYQTLTIFSDNAGIASGTDGSIRMYMIAPNIVNEVAVSNSTNSPTTAIDISRLPILSREQGYNLRQGASGNYNVVVAEKIGTNRGSMVYLYNNREDALAVGTTALTGQPSGNQTYRGLYSVGLRGTNWVETGSVTLQANFNSGTFYIDASSDDTTLSGSGFVEVSSGQVSGSNLRFTDVDYGSYSANTMGLIGGTDGSEIVGLWYTNESDGDPDFAGGYAVTN